MSFESLKNIFLTMDYLVYILAGFGIFSLMVIILKFILWALKCDFDKQFVPIGESALYTVRNSVINMNAKEAIDQMDRMLEQYTKPKVVISRQCICPFCTKETEKIIINDLNSDDIDGENRCLKDDDIIEENESKTDLSIESENTVVEVDDIIIIEGSKEEMPCNMYNNVVSELRSKFESLSKSPKVVLNNVRETDATENEIVETTDLDHNDIIIEVNLENTENEIVESTNM